MSIPAPVAAWHRIAAAPDPTDPSTLAALDDLLADDVVFRSPAVHAPQEGRQVTTVYLRAAMVVLGPTLRYLDEWYAETLDGGSAVLEFAAQVGGRDVHGVDQLRWDAEGRLTSFTVMVRPLRALEALIEAMAAELAPPA